MHKHKNQPIIAFVRPVLMLIFVANVIAAFAVAANTMALGGGIVQEQPKTIDILPPTPSVTTSITNGAAISQKEQAKANAAKQPLKQQASKIGAVAEPSNTAIGSQQAAKRSLYVDPALRQQGRPERIAGQAVATWFGGWNANVQSDVTTLVSKAAAGGKVTTLVAYNIPSRDCGSYSAGGANSSAAYRSWIQRFAAGIGARTAIVILEPDALAGMDCLSPQNQSQRLADMSYAVSLLAGTGAVTYLDAGNYSWQSTAVMATRLKAANVAAARGFSLNVSGYGWTNQSIAYGQKLVSAIGGGKGFVIDTSRNGNGPAPNNEWCNPRGRSLGVSPSTTTNVATLDAYLWVKVPGESDGECNRGNPTAGEWWPEIANELIGNAR